MKMHVAGAANVEALTLTNSTVSSVSEIVSFFGGVCGALVLFFKDLGWWLLLFICIAVVVHMHRQSAIRRTAMMNQVGIYSSVVSGMTLYMSVIVNGFRVTDSRFEKVRRFRSDLHVGLVLAFLWASQRVCTILLVGGLGGAVRC